MLLSQVRAGDEDAMNRLLARCLPSLLRWAHGRLPVNARDANETADVVQEAVISTLRQLGHFEARREGALQAYLRTAVARRIIDLIRRRQRQPEPTEVPDDLADDGTSPLDRAIGAENTARYEAALQRFSDVDREAIVCRPRDAVCINNNFAVALDKPTPPTPRASP